MKITDYSGKHPIKVHSISETFTLIDGFYTEESAISFANHMLGSFNNAGESGKTEMYTTALVVRNNRVIHTFTNFM